MKKARISEFRLLALAILILAVSYYLDNQVSLYFKDTDSITFKTIFGVVTNMEFIFVIIILTPSILLHKKNKKSIYLLWLTAFISFVLAFILKLIVLRDRPADVLIFPFTNIIDYSFPSMHAMIVFSVLPLLASSLPKYRHFWVLFAFAVAFSRVYFRFHFLSDVVFGALAGYFIGNWLFDLHKRGKVWK
ncbi:phosphatase PAP2 family protein [Candidatus Woesearchaeota archaeon]|nr:phosphatase PAP2 family protein [Candidatus Woesearchaeota archaeon]